MINNWDGSLDLGSDGGTVLAPRIVAGSKDKTGKTNTFSGVMMGDWEGTDSEGSITRNIGLYGFHNGE